MAGKRYIYRVRKRLGVNQLKMAETLGVSQSLISLMETGARTVTPQIKERLKELEASIQ